MLFDGQGAQCTLTLTIKEAIALGSGVEYHPARILRNEVEQGRLAAVPNCVTRSSRPLGIIHRRRSASIGRSVVPRSAPELPARLDPSVLAI